MNASRIPVIVSIITGILLLPSIGLIHAMPVPSEAPVQVQTQNIEPESGGYIYAGYDPYYYEGDWLLLFLESCLYVGLVLGSIIILDEHLDNVTIIIRE